MQDTQQSLPTRQELEFVATRWYVQRAAILRSFSKSPDLSQAAMPKAAKRIRKFYARFLDAAAVPLSRYFLEYAPPVIRTRDYADRQQYAQWRLRNARYCRQALYWHPAGHVFCNLAEVCPFCCGRSAGEAWDRVSAHLFPPAADGSRPETAAFDLVATTRTVWHAPGDLAEFFRARLAARRNSGLVGVQGRYPEIAGMKCPAAYDVMTTQTIAAPADDGKVVPRFETTIRQLFAVAPGEAFGAYPPSDVIGGVVVSRIPTPNLLAAADAVARLCRYPRGLIIPPKGIDPAIHARGVVYFLECRRRRQLWVPYGGFRAGPTTPTDAASE